MSTNRARSLRRRATRTETRFWELVRNRKADGLKFRRQHPAGPYVLDFYCHEKRVAVEFDGAGHDRTDQRWHDRKRDVFLRERGIRVLRFKNHEVWLRPGEVLERVMEVCRER